MKFKLVVLTLMCICGAARADDTLVYTSGVKIDCKVLRLTDDGHVLFKAPFLDAEARGVMAHISAINLPSRPKPEVGADAVILVNGDRLAGEILVMDADKIVLKSVILGRVEVPRNVVVMTTARVGNVLHETDFRFVQSTAPWKLHRGSAQVVDGALVCKPGTRLTIAMEQKKALTMEVVFVRRLEHFFAVPYVDMVFFADSHVNGYGMNSVRMDMDGYRFGFASICKGKYTWHTRGTRFQWLTERGIEPKPVRVAYDPKVPEMSCWVEGRIVRRQRLTGASPKTGQHLSLAVNAGGTVFIQSIRVLSGVVPPVGGVRDDAAAETDTVVMADGKRYTAESVVLTPEGYVAQTAAGKMTIKRDQVACVLFADNKRVAPRRVKGDVRVRAGSHVLTMQLTGLTPTELTGVTSACGAVKFDRTNVGIITFNIYASRPAPKEPKPPVPHRPPFGELDFRPIPMPMPMPFQPMER